MIRLHGVMTQKTIISVNMIHPTPVTLIFLQPDMFLKLALSLLHHAKSGFTVSSCIGFLTGRFHSQVSDSDDVSCRVT